MAEFSNTARQRSSLVRRASSACLRAVMSMIAPTYDVARFISYGMCHNEDTLDSSIRQEQSMLKIQIGPVQRCAIDSLLYKDGVVRVNALKHEFECWLRPSIVFHDLIGFL